MPLASVKGTEYSEGAIPRPSSKREVIQLMRSSYIAVLVLSDSVRTEAGPA